MNRLINPDITNATADAKALFEKITKAVGKVPNAYATIGLLHPAALGHLLAADAVVSSSGLSKAEVEAIRLAISSDNGCDYCVAAHTYIGKLAGLNSTALANLRAGEGPGDAKLDALVRFALAVNESKGTVPVEVVTAVTNAGYTPSQVVAALFVISAITFTNLVNRVNDTTVDFPNP